MKNQASQKSNKLPEAVAPNTSAIAQALAESRLPTTNKQLLGDLSMSAKSSRQTIAAWGLRVSDIFEKAGIEFRFRSHRQLTSRAVSAEKTGPRVPFTDRMCTLGGMPPPHLVAALCGAVVLHSRMHLWRDRDDGDKHLPQPRAHCWTIATIARDTEEARRAVSQRHRQHSVARSAVAT
jgi:hypothetical protein